MYGSLCTQYTLSRDAIWDLREEEEFEELIQGLLKANYGMNWDGWWELVEWNFLNRGTEENRMYEREEREIILKIVEDWLRREEVGKLWNVKERVLAFQNRLNGIELAKNV
jgi:hypothetical protein